MESYAKITHDLFSEYQEKEIAADMPALHYHNHYEIYLLMDGERQYLMGGRLISLHPMDAVLIPPKKLHKSCGNAPFKRYLFNFNKEYLYKYYTNETIDRLLRCFEKPKLSLTQEQFERLRGSLTDFEAGEELRFLYLGDILALLSRAAEQNGSKVIDVNPTVSRLLSYIEGHYAEINNLDAIAAQFHISKSYLCRLFKSQTEVTLVQYLNSVKAQHARELLDSTDLSVTEVAFGCGFHSSAYFCKVFKEITNISPYKYRRRNT